MLHALGAVVVAAPVTSDAQARTALASVEVLVSRDAVEALVVLVAAHGASGEELALAVASLWSS